VALVMLRCDTEARSLPLAEFATPIVAGALGERDYLADHERQLSLDPELQVL